MSDRRGTRERILEAAIAVIETDGEPGLRVDTVVQLAGFTKPVLYHHFGSRDDLVEVAQAERYRRSLAEGLAGLLALEPFDAFDSTDAFLDTLTVGMGDFTSAEGRRRRALRMEVLGAATQRPHLHAAITEANREFVTGFADALSRARDAGLITPVWEPRDLAAWWLSMVAGRQVIDADTEVLDGQWAPMVMSIVRFLLTGGR